MHKRLLVVAMLVVVGMVLPLTADAVCSIRGEVVRVTDSSASSVAYLRPSALSSIIYYGYGPATNPDLRNALRSCENSRHRCYLLGSGASCPTSGTFRFVGTILTVIANP
jgi:hypothetical protein